MTSFAIADIHGNYDALSDVIALSGFNPASDRIIVLGDVVDYGSRSRECIEFLLGLPDRILILGNHDAWFLEWIETGELREEWVSQGGAETMCSYSSLPENVPKSHSDLLKRALPYYVDEKMRLFVHGGFDPAVPIQDQPVEQLLWNRRLIAYAARNQVPGYSLVFIGHSPTQQFGRNYPLMLHNLVMCDTGARLGECLTLID
ncbi:MAG: metallophosphoesterase, partial [Methanoregulaceae archaeon]|nr:metallophosphoesterase [Methanoregulaceae archaeon]